MDSSSAAKLASLLDKIDSSKSNEPAASEHEPKTHLTSQAPVTVEHSGWYEFKDVMSGKSYYHNYITSVTQWKKPDANDIVPPPAPITRPVEDVPVERAYFSKGSGHFSHTGSQSYWAKMGREEDKAGRQLGVFMDLSTLEQNREEAKRMKEEAQRNSGSRGDVDWRAHREQKLSAKKRKAQSWLYDD